MRKWKWDLINDQWGYVVMFTFYFGAAGIDGGWKFVAKVMIVSFFVLYAMALVARNDN